MSNFITMYKFHQFKKGLKKKIPDQTNKIFNKTFFFIKKIKNNNYSLDRKKKIIKGNKIIKNNYNIKNKEIKKKLKLLINFLRNNINIQYKDLQKIVVSNDINSIIYSKKKIIIKEVFKIIDSYNTHLYDKMKQINNEIIEIKNNNWKVNFILENKNYYIDYCYVDFNNMRKNKKLINQRIWKLIKLKTDLYKKINIMKIKEKHITLILKFELILKNIYLKIKIKNWILQKKKLHSYNKEIEIYNNDYLYIENKLAHTTKMREFINIIKDLDNNIINYIKFQFNIQNYEYEKFREFIENSRLFLYSIFMKSFKNNIKYYNNIIIDNFSVKYKNKTKNYIDFNDFQFILKVLNFPTLNNPMIIYQSIKYLFGNIIYNTFVKFFKIESKFVKSKVLCLEKFIGTIDHINIHLLENNHEFRFYNNYIDVLKNFFNFFNEYRTNNKTTKNITNFEINSDDDN